MKKLVVLVSILCILLMTVIGCKKEEEAAEPIKVEEKHFADVHIIFFPGGSEGGPFASVVFNGARAAQDDLGPQVDYLWSGWLPCPCHRSFGRG